MGNTDSTIENEEPPSSTHNWVTVFGFPPDKAYTVLQFFSRHGEAPPKGNWLHVCYSCPVHARQALTRNGAILDGTMRIGVIPTPEKELSGNDTNVVLNTTKPCIVEQSIREEPEEEQALSQRDQNISIMDTSLNGSRMSSVSRAGMRPLNSPFRPRTEVHMEEQQSSFMSKLWNTVGF